MKHIAKSIIALYIVINYFIFISFGTIELLLLFALFAVTLFMETKSKAIHIIVIIIECIIVFFIGIYTDYFIFAVMIILLDIMFSRLLYLLLIPAVEFVYFECYLLSNEIFLSLIFVICIGYLISINDHKKKEYLEALDKDRKIKYELEIAKADLLKSSDELQRLTKVNERNRIARDLHDNIGHKIAGVLISLQAANKIFDKDRENGKKMLDECIEHLKSSLQVIRDTVHNMYSEDTLSINSVKKIINDYKYCNVDLQIVGLFNTCPQKIMMTLCYIIKESLTNTAKHSNADNVNVTLSCVDSVVTMEACDNGIGCIKIKESLGIKSMRDRVKSSGGTIQIDGSNGMKISCIIPYK